MRGYRCDRCNEFVENEMIDDGEFVKFRYREEHDDEFLEQDEHRYDLCNECRGELIEWIEQTVA